MAESTLAVGTKIGEVARFARFPGIRDGTAETCAHLSEIHFGEMGRYAHLPGMRFGVGANCAHLSELGLPCVAKSVR